MARRRMTDYGTTALPKQSNPGGFPLPPPPDGTAPVRLPFRTSPPEQPPLVGSPEDDVMEQLLKMVRGAETA